MVSDEAKARAQRDALDDLQARSKRRAELAVRRAYQSAIDRYELTGAPAISPQARDDMTAAMAAIWRDALRTGAGFPDMQEKGAFMALDTKAAPRLTLFEAIMLQFISRFGAQRVTNINATTLSQIVKMIDAGVKEGLSVQSIARAMRAQIPMLTSARSALIARTETHTAAMHASQEVAKTAIEPMNKRWMSIEDHRTRDFGEGDGVVDMANHRAMHEVTCGIDELFSVPNKRGGFDLMSGPSDPAAPAYQICNCRCAMIYRRASRAWPKKSEGL